MLRIWCGYCEGEVELPDGYFNSLYEDEWFNDAFVKEMVLDVDKTEIISPNLAVSPVLGAIPPTQISGGVKSLIMMWKCDDYIADAEAMGENCGKWIVEIANRKADSLLCMEGCMYLGKLDMNVQFNALIENTGRKISKLSEYYDAVNNLYPDFEKRPCGYEPVVRCRY